MVKKETFNDSATVTTNANIPLQANYYVYALLDPQNNEIFYIGKGKNGRIMDHVAEAKKAMSGIVNPSNKVKRIISILNNQNTCPKFVVLRSGLSEETAYEVEGMMIDFLTCTDYDFCGIADLQNIQSGHHNDTNGIQTLDDLRRVMNATDCVILDDEKILAISINQTYFSTHRNVYQAVRSCWYINLQRARRADYVVAVFQGVIVGVYEHVIWSPVTKMSPVRHEFTATPVTNQVVLNRLLYKKWTLGFGSGCPIRYTYN